MAVNSIAGFTPTIASSSSGTKGFNDMTGDDFMRVMIAQLQQQDPLDPAKSDQLLTQMSQIKQLESSTALKKSLEGLTLQQSIGAGGNLIGKTIDGIDDNGDGVTGTVTSVKVLDKAVYLELDTGKELPLSSVTQIANGGSTTSSTMQSLLASPQVQTVLAQMGLTGTQLSEQQLSQVLSSPQAQSILASLTQQSAQTTGATGSPISSLLSMVGL